MNVSPSSTSAPDPRNNYQELPRLAPLLANHRPPGGKACWLPSPAARGEVFSPRRCLSWKLGGTDRQAPSQRSGPAPGDPAVPRQTSDSCRVKWQKRGWSLQQTAKETGASNAMQCKAMLHQRGTSHPRTHRRRNVVCSPRLWGGFRGRAASTFGPRTASWRVQKGGPGMRGGLGSTIWGGKLKELGVFSLEKEGDAGGCNTSCVVPAV